MTTSDTILAAIIAGAVALTVGLIAQIISVVNQVLSHRYAQRREVQKYYNEVYQKLFIPAIPDVFLYIDMVSSFRRGHDATQEQEIEVKDRVITHVGEHLLYASPKLVLDYQSIHRYRIGDESGANPSQAELHFLLSFVSEYEYVIRQSSIYTGKVQRTQLKPIIRYRILYFLLANRLEVVLPYSFWFDKDVLTDKSYSKLNKIITVMQNCDGKILEDASNNYIEYNTTDEAEIRSLNELGNRRAIKMHENYKNNKVQTVTDIIELLITDQKNCKHTLDSIIASIDYDFQTIRKTFETQ